MAYNTDEFGGAKGAYYHDSTIASGVFTPPTGYFINAILPNPSVTLTATPLDTTNCPYISSTRAVGGVAVSMLKDIYGQYSTCTVTAGSCVIYVKRISSNVL